jgi:hypothetical protein
MRDHISLGPVPAEESCQQVGTQEYDPQAARAECKRFVGAIRLAVGPEPEGAILRITSNPHDFGSYYDVEVWYDAENEQASEYASHCDSSAPTTWPEGV